MKRSPSAGYGFEPNKNTDWLEDKYFFVYYALLILGVALTLRESNAATRMDRRTCGCPVFCH
jgi:hypothetical protein